MKIRTLPQLKNAVRKVVTHIQAETGEPLYNTYDAVANTIWLSVTNDNWDFDYVLFYVSEVYETMTEEYSEYTFANY